MRYDILECEQCEVSFADPRVSRDWIYARIYAQPERLFGYERYERHARAVEASSSPLHTLAEREDVYYAVAAMLRELRLAPAARILEIGSGLGYLTYALVKAGYRAEGWDVSSTAVESATRRFGPHYALKNANDLEADETGRFDVVIFTQFIEHLEDPIAFVRAAKSLLLKDGVLLVTTDNKSYYDPAPVWQTDLPPVHLWWFTERSLMKIAAENGLSTLFFDFHDYNRDRPWEKNYGVSLDVPTIGPRLNEAGDSICVFSEPEPWRFFPLTHSVFPAIVGLARALERGVRGRRTVMTAHPRGRRASTMAAMLRPEG